MTSAAFTIEGTAVPAAVAVAYGATVTFAATDLTGAVAILWEITGSSNSSYTNPTITPGGVPTGTTATCTQIADPGTGLGAGFEVKLTVTDSQSRTYTQKGIFGTTNLVGIIPLVSGETASRSDTHGWVELINQSMISSGKTSVLSFGAKGDGVTDNAAAFQSAIDAVILAGGGSVYVPSGAYLINSQLVVDTTVPFQFIGDGAEVTELSWNFDDDFLKFTAAASSVAISDLMIRPRLTITEDKFAIKSVVSSGQFRVDRVIIRDLASVGSPGGGIDLGPSSSLCWITDCLICDLVPSPGGTTFGGTGIRVGAGSEVRINGNRIYGTNASAASEYGAIGIDITGDMGGCYLTDNAISICGHGIFCRDTGAGTNRELQLGSSNSLDGCFIGIEINDSVGLQASGTSSGACTYAAMKLDTGSPYIQWVGGGFCRNGLGPGGGGSNGRGIAVHGGSPTVFLYGNTFIDNVGESISSACGEYWIISGCYFATSAIGITVTGSATHWSANGNTFNANTTGSYTGAAFDVWANNIGS